MWPPKRLDVGWRDLAAAASYVACGQPDDALRDGIARQWRQSADEHLVCLSVRTGFDLLLQALQLPAGSEVLFSALTIPDMPRIAKLHALVPVPIDLDPATLEPRLELLEQAVTPRTKLIVTAHLFGARVPMHDIARFAREHNLLSVEDNAQGFRGATDSSEGSDVSMLSFGPIKTCTALGGGVLRVRNGELLDRMRRIEARYAVQSRAFFLRRTVKYAALHALSHAIAYEALVRTGRAFGADVDRLSSRLVRGFHGANLLARLRQRPSRPLLALMLRRLTHFRRSEIARRAARGRWVQQQLADVLSGAGNQARDHTHWVLPVITCDAQRLMAALREAGFHATLGHNLGVVDAPADRPWLEPRAARKLQAESVFLPFYADLPDAELSRMTAALRRQAGRLAPMRAPSGA